jgi:hypothetical protein
MYHIQTRVRATRDLTRVLDAYDDAITELECESHDGSRDNVSIDEADAVQSFESYDEEDVATLEERIRQFMLTQLHPLEFKIEIMSINQFPYDAHFYADSVEPYLVDPDAPDRSYNEFMPVRTAMFGF